MFDNVKDRRLFEKIVDQIKDAILSGTLKPGDKLPSEHELARLFGVSRSAVREALRILELSGIVVIKKGNQGGCFIQEVNSSQQLIDYLSDNWKLGQIKLVDLTEARYWLESIVIEIVGQKITQKDLDALRSSIDEAEHFYKEGKEQEKINKNFDFHGLLVRMTGNTILIDTLSAIIELLSYFLCKIKPSRQITLNTFKAHREIVDFLEAGQVESAKTANKLHIKDVNNRLIKKSSSQGNPPNLELEGRSLFLKEESENVQ